MITLTSEYKIYLYVSKVDMRKDISGLIGIIQSEMGSNAYETKNMYVFMSRDRRTVKVLIREYNRFELTKIRLDKGQFLRPKFDDERLHGRISWSDYVLLTESLSKSEATIRSIDRKG